MKTKKKVCKGKWPEFQWNYMDSYQNNQNPGFEMQNIPLIYEKVSAFSWYISSTQSEQQHILFPATTSILIEVQH